MMTTNFDQRTPRRRLGLAGIASDRTRGIGNSCGAGLDHSTIQATDRRRPGRFVRAQALVLLSDDHGVGNFIGIGALAVAKLASLDSEDRAGHPTLPVLAVVWFARQNHFEWMFNPLTNSAHAKANVLHSLVNRTWCWLYRTTENPSLIPFG